VLYLGDEMTTPITAHSSDITSYLAIQSFELEFKSLGWTDDQWAKTLAFVDESSKKSVLSVIDILNSLVTCAEFASYPDDDDINKWWNIIYRKYIL
jgi:hypothetical protein